MIHIELIRPLHELLDRHASERPEQVAVRDDRREVTYGELLTRTGRLAGQLVALGVDRGERVAIYADDCVETVEAYAAIARAAAVAVCVNPSAAKGEVAHMLSDSDAAVILTDGPHLERVLELARDLPALRRVLVVRPPERPPSSQLLVDYEELIGRAPKPPRDDLDLDEPAWMVYTSGTTGRPKGALLNQRTHLWVAAACWPPIAGLGPDDYVLSPLPLFHAYGLGFSVVAVLAVGATERIIRFSSGRVLACLRREPITVMAGVPTMYHYILERSREEGAQARALRVCFSAGAIMPAALNAAFEEAFQVPLLDGYGTTETATMVTMNWPTGGRIMGSCGLPLPGSTVRVVDPASGDEVADGTDGELWVRGPHLMIGYHKQPEATAEALAGGWYHTGDLGHRDRHGYLTITGRIKELIIRGGENIYPAEVEHALIEHDAVLDAAVVGRPHEALGEEVVAFIVTRPGIELDAGDIRAFLLDRIASTKIPVEMHPIDEIPRTGSGKILRHRLAERLEHAQQHAAGR
jgi:acyl-CoA synthetase (AMP-forming)/AMP-acid ligase II